jgi:ring-1,2-phenylacetyl-CoA epoxidase subunit PaaE
MTKYITLKIKEVIVETDDACTLVFDNEFDYQPGQFLTLITKLNETEQRRSYSLSSASNIGDKPSITVKKVTNGLVSSYLVNHVQQGDVLQAMLPTGNFTINCHKNNSRHILLIGAGSGISPLIYLLYGSRNENSIILYHQLEQLKVQYGAQLFIVHSFSQPLHSASHAGRLNQSHILKIVESFPHIDLANCQCYICGPEGMMHEAQSAMKILNISKENVHQESFLPAGSAAKPFVAMELNSKSKVEKQTVKIIYSGAEYMLEVPADKSILQAALDKKIDLPYSCQSGMCTACMGKCTSGVLKLHDPDGLSENEINNGYMLTCVAQPLSANVVIEID